MTAWELKISRIREDQRDARRRTISVYSIWVDGFDTHLWGYVAEPGGPGDNAHMGNDRRIEAGKYGLKAHVGPHYATVDYSRGADYPRPAVELTGTGNRQAILWHPGQGFLSSIGCLNPCSNLLEPYRDIDYGDSRAHVVRLINNLRSFCGEDWLKLDKPIPNVSVVIHDPTGNMS